MVLPTNDRCSGSVVSFRDRLVVLFLPPTRSPSRHGRPLRHANLALVRRARPRGDPSAGDSFRSSGRPSEVLSSRRTVVPWACAVLAVRRRTGEGGPLEDSWDWETFSSLLGSTGVSFFLVHPARLHFSACLGLFVVTFNCVPLCARTTVGTPGAWVLSCYRLSVSFAGPTRTDPPWEAFVPPES